FFAGLHAQSNLNETLNYITGPAWDTADGAMEATISIEREMLLLNRVFAGKNIDTQLIKTAKVDADDALERLKAANLLDQELITGIDADLKEFRDSGIAIQTSYTNYQSALTSFNTHTAEFADLIAIAEEQGDGAVEALKNDPSYEISWDNGLAEKWQAADGGMEASIGFFQQMYFLALMKSEGVSEKLQAQLNEATAFQHGAVEEMLASGLYTNTVPAEFGSGSLEKVYKEYLAQHTQLLNQVVLNLNNFQQQQSLYDIASDKLMQQLAVVEGQADQQVENKVEGIAEQQATTSTTMIMILLGCLAVLIFIAYYVRAHVIKTLLEITYSLHQVADGDGDLTRRLKYNQQDELGDICRSFNRFSEKISTIVEEVNTKSEQLDAGIETCVSLSQRISKETAGTATSASGVSKAIEQVQDGATEIAS
ncbi:MAG: HAMP domain-containing protein, partial [Oleibacter sp.]|nr:HAMP domain-containing protein [Thalassolituus sp.]